MITTNTNLINEILSNYNKGIKIPRASNVFFRNNIGLLNANICFNYTPEELSEYILCGNSIEYFIEKYLGIVLRKYQKEWIKAFTLNRFNIIMNSRQTGISEIFSCVILHYSIFNHGKNILIRSQMGDISQDFISRIKKRCLKLPYFLKPQIDKLNNKSMYFNNGTKIVTKLKDIEPIDNINLLFYLDFAHIPSANEEYINLYPSVLSTNDSKIIIQSGPNGLNSFNNLVQGSERGINNFKVIKTYWWEVPSRDDAWKDNEISKIGIDAFNQEYDLQFFSYKK